MTYDGNLTSIALEDALGGPLGTLGTFKLRQHMYRCCIRKSKVEATLFHNTAFYSPSSLDTIFRAIIEVILQIIRLPHQLSVQSFTTPPSGQSDHIQESPPGPMRDASMKSLLEIDAVVLLQWMLEILTCNKARILQVWTPIQGTTYSLLKTNNIIKNKFFRVTQSNNV